MSARSSCANPWHIYDMLISLKDLVYVLTCTIPWCQILMGFSVMSNLWCRSIMAGALV